MLSKSNIQEIINIFKKDLPNIFANEIVFAFLCGSLAKNKILENSDIDMFICLSKKDNEKNKIFLSWYKSIHKKYGLKPDHRFPGEVIDLNILDKSLKNLSKSSLQLAAENIKFEDGLVWTGMLSSKNKAFVGKKSHFLKRKKVADNIIEKWRKQFLKDINPKEPDIFLKQLTQFYKSHNETKRHFPKIK